MIGTKIFRNPECTSTESQEDWHLRTSKKQLMEDGKKVERRHNVLLIDGCPYRWSDIDNKLVAVSNIHNKKSVNSSNVQPRSKN